MVFLRASANLERKALRRTKQKISRNRGFLYIVISW